jgi:hypothetical protein
VGVNSHIVLKASGRQATDRRALRAVSDEPVWPTRRI